MDDFLTKVGDLLKYVQVWFKILAERLVWMFNWKDVTEETLSSITETKEASEAE